MKRVYTIGAAAEKIESQIGDAAEIDHAGTLETALQRAAATAQAGDIVLLAPACASFDQFRNYEHRGRVFKEVVGRAGGGSPQPSVNASGTLALQDLRSSGSLRSLPALHERDARAYMGLNED